MDLQKVIALAIPVLKKYRVKKAALFGSLVRGETHEGSDIDMLVDLPEKASLFDFIDLQLQLEDVLHKKVDLVTYDAIKPRLKPFILRDEMPIYLQS